MKKTNFKVLAMAMVLLFAWAGMTMAALVVPTLYERWQSGNAAFECGQVECCDSYFHYKFDSWADVPVDYDGDYTVDGGNIINISNNDGFSFNWTSAWPVSCVIVKGGNAANVYCYSGGAYGDTGMFAPTKYDKDGNPVGTFEISHVTFCYNEDGMCFEEETAWAEGTPYVKKGSWAMYSAYSGEEKTVDLIADGGDPATAKVVGTATFSAPNEGYVTITIILTDAIFYYDLNDPLYDDNLKVQDYDKAPNKNPAPGKFDWKTRIEPGSTAGSIAVPQNNFYGVHLDVAVPVPCE